MEQLVIIAIVGLISLVNWLMKRSAEVREERRLERQRQGIPEGDPFHPAESAEGRTAKRAPEAHPSPDMRRLMEALGLPQDDEEFINPEDVPEIRRPAPANPPPPPLPVFQPLPRPELRSGKFKNIDVALSQTATVSPLAVTLHSHEGLRQGIVLREILGPPKALTL